MAKKIGYKNWLSSARKWVEIKKKVKEKEKFVLQMNGFWALDVITPCGYCEEFGDCESCLLFLKGVENIPICFRHLRKTTHFTHFIEAMRTKKPKFEIALRHAEVVLNAILEDCPDKDRATKDGIVFE